MRESRRGWDSEPVTEADTLSLYQVQHDRHQHEQAIRAVSCPSCGTWTGYVGRLCRPCTKVWEQAVLTARADSAGVDPGDCTGPRAGDDPAWPDRGDSPRGRVLLALLVLVVAVMVVVTGLRHLPGW